MLILLITACAMLAGFFAGAGVCMAVSRWGGRAGRKTAREIPPRDEELLKAVESYGRR